MKEVAQNYDIPLHDIKPIVNIQEYSLYYFIATVGLGLIVLGVVVYYLYKWYNKRNRFKLRVHHKELMDNIKLGDTKNAAYQITICAGTFKDDNPDINQQYQTLIDNLEQYKYKKEVEEFDSDTVAQINLYRSMINV